MNHLRVRGPLPAGVGSGAPLPLCDEFPTRDTDTRAEEGLRTNMYALAQKQNSIILELKGQCRSGHIAFVFYFSVSFMGIFKKRFKRETLSKEDLGKVCNP